MGTEHSREGKGAAVSAGQGRSCSAQGSGSCIAPGQRPPPAAGTLYVHCTELQIHFKSSDSCRARSELPSASLETDALVSLCARRGQGAQPTVPGRGRAGQDGHRHRGRSRWSPAPSRIAQHRASGGSCCEGPSICPSVLPGATASCLRLLPSRALSVLIMC